MRTETPIRPFHFVQEVRGSKALRLRNLSSRSYRTHDLWKFRPDLRILAIMQGIGHLGRKTSFTEYLTRDRKYRKRMVMTQNWPNNLRSNYSVSLLLLLKIYVSKLYIYVVRMQGFYEAIWRHIPTDVMPLKSQIILIARFAKVKEPESGTRYVVWMPAANFGADFGVFQKFWQAE